MKKKLLSFLAIICSLCVMCGCATEQKDYTEESAAQAADSISVGFSQVGAESDWRSANTDSMKSSLTKENGFDLIFMDGQQKQTKQITAIRSFIQQGVDYIVLAPVCETGWDSVLDEAYEANIPVIIVDRMIQINNDNRYSCFVGSDFYLEGRKACEWLNQYATAYDIAKEDIHIVDIQGTIGSTAQIGRTKGLVESAKKYGWDIREKTSGDFTQAKGREVMAQMLRQYNNINVVYCENDNEALGAIEAIEAAGKHAGSNLKNGDILVLSFDGINETAINYALEGTIACIVECNPLHGPRVRTIIDSLERGENPDKIEYVDETLYSSVNVIKSVTVDGAKYDVTLLTQDVIDSREY